MVEHLDSDSGAPRRERLRVLLRDECVLYRRDGHSIVDYEGKPLRWIYYQWGASLSPEGSALLCEALLKVLATFESDVIASVGMTGAPLIGALVAIGKGRYHGLCVRKEREAYGTRRIVEGAAPKGRRVVVIDDCICSGKSLKHAFTALEEDGYLVEGAVVVANFPTRGGSEWVRSLGYRLETLFDVRDDLEAEWSDPAEPTETVPDQGPHQVPDALSPADAARWVANYYFEHHMVPLSPESFSGDFDSTGGMMVSFRDRDSNYRVARNGFYRFEPEGNTPADLVRATVKTVATHQDALAKYGLDRLKIGVTCIGSHEPVGVDQLDFFRYGIVAKSTDTPSRYGAALPNTQFFVSEIEQLRHARFTNARLTEAEPYVLLRHTITKSVETAASWPAFGVSEPPIEPEDKLGGAALQLVRDHLSKGDLTLASSATYLRLDSSQIHGVAVSLYRRGIIGCWTSFRGSLEEMLRDAADRAWADDRYADKKVGLCLDEVSVVVSFFYDREDLGNISANAASVKIRAGKDSLLASKDGESGLILGHIPVQYDWSKKAFADAVLRKGNNLTEPCRWTAFATKSWLGHENRVSALDAGYPTIDPPEELDVRHLIRQIATYICGQFEPSGLPAYAYQPILNYTLTVGSSVRIVLALEALLDAADALEDPALGELAKFGLRRFCDAVADSVATPSNLLSAGGDGVSGEVALVSAIYRMRDVGLIAHPGVQGLRNNVEAVFHGDGVISTRPDGYRMNIDHDFFPGSALRMAARIASVEGPDSLPRSLGASLVWYRRRFGLQHPWGMIWWQIQAWTAIRSVTPDPSPVDFIYEMADWATANQLRKNGAFLVDYATDGPGFHTACVMEGLADASYVARVEGDGERAEVYKDSWARGAQFISRLVLRHEDTYAMPEPEKCVGGVRASLTSSNLRIDFAAHALSALCKGHTAAFEPRERLWRPNRNGSE